MTEEHNSRRSPTRFLWGLLGLGILAALVAVWIRFWRKILDKKSLEESEPIQHIVLEGIRGLTEDEAESRRMEGQDNVVSFDPPRPMRAIIKENVLTIFNFSLLGVASTQFIVGRYLDALISLGIALLNISIQVGQELFVQKRLENVIRTTRPQATVIREGRARSIDPSEIVKGDALVVGPGDQFIVDGELLSEKPILVNESRITGDSTRLTKRSGDQVYAGSYCISGRAAYRAQKVGEERLVAKMVANSPAQKKVLTPLERIVERVLRVMLIIVAILFSTLLVHYFRLDKTVGVDLDTIVSATGVIFSLAPAGLFFMIFLNYVSGTAKLARHGALAHSARSVETLADARIICITQGSISATAVVREEAIKTPGQDGKVADSRLRQILGDYGRSSSTTNLAVLGLADSFPGEQRFPKEEAPFLSAYGWTATVFDDDDLWGVYVLGEPRVLEPYLVVSEGDDQPEETSPEEEGKPSLTKTFRQGISGLGRFFLPKEKPSEEKSIQNSSEVGQPQPPHATNGIEEQEDAHPDEGDQSGNNQRNPFQALFKRVGTALQRRPEGSQDEAEASTEDSEAASGDELSKELVYLFAYHPDIVALHDGYGEPQIPQDLLPLCYLYYSQEVRPEAIEIVRKFTDTGVNLKLFSPGAPDRLVAAFQKADMGGASYEIQRVIHGSELVALEEAAFRSAAREKTVFGYITPELARQVVQTLRDDGNTVAVVGGGPSDLPIMQQADLSIATYGSSQAALSVADILLLKESPKVFMKVLEEGQKIVNGLLDVLKLYLTQLICLVVLILVLVGGGFGFPYISKQGAFIAIATLTIPSLGFSLWSLPGAPPKVDSLGRTLTWFVAPSALTISITGVALYFYFLNSTGEIAYAQLALTHMLVVSGLALVVLVRPPTRHIRKRETNQTGAEESNALGRDWRPTILVLGVMLIFVIIVPMRWTQYLFRLDVLRQGMDYLVVGLAVLAWVATVEIIWRTLTPKPYRPR